MVALNWTRRVPAHMMLRGMMAEAMANRYPRHRHLNATGAKGLSVGEIRIPAEPGGNTKDEITSGPYATKAYR